MRGLTEDWKRSSCAECARGLAVFRALVNATGTNPSLPRSVSILNDLTHHQQPKRTAAIALSQASANNPKYCEIREARRL